MTDTNTEEPVDLTEDEMDALVKRLVRSIRERRHPGRQTSGAVRDTSRPTANSAL